MSYLPGVCRRDTAGYAVGRRVLAVKIPRQRVIGNVLADTLEGIVVTNDVFVVVALPEWWVFGLGTGVVPKFGESTRREAFEPMDSIRQSERVACRQTRPWLGAVSGRRGRLPRLPVPQQDDSIDVIRHHDERINLHGCIVVWYFGPRRRDHGPCCSQRYVAVHHPSKETGLPDRADSDEVCTWSGVVEFGKAKRGPMVMRASDRFVGRWLVAHAVIVHRPSAHGQAWEPAPTVQSSRVPLTGRRGSLPLRFRHTHRPLRAGVGACPYGSIQPCAPHGQAWESAPTVPSQPCTPHGQAWEPAPTVPPHPSREQKSKNRRNTCQ